MAVILSFRLEVHGLSPVISSGGLCRSPDCARDGKKVQNDSSGVSFLTGIGIVAIILLWKV